MKISDFLSEGLIVPDLRATTREEVLVEIVARIAAVRADVDRAVAVQMLMERERLGSTGIGSGTAFPHAKLPHVGGVVGCFARSKKGVEFGSLDAKPVYLFLTLLAPEGGAGLHLKALARASRLFKDAELKTRLLGADDGELWDMIAREDKRLAAHD